MNAIVQFLTAIAGPLTELFEHVMSGKQDAEKEREIALSIVFAAKRLQAEREL